MKTLFILLLAAGLAPAQEKKDQQKEKKEPIKVGVKAPEFTLKNHKDKEVILKKVLEKEWVVLAFYPRASTPG
jgi:cytochrome oxidase Cu insertion factor (SCO1/SenC/PrrC family)